jgi:hypothetical protein
MYKFQLESRIGYGYTRAGMGAGPYRWGIGAKPHNTTAPSPITMGEGVGGEGLMAGNPS